MARSVLAALVGIQLVALSLGCSSGGGSSGGGTNIPSSSSGRPFGIDINDRTEIYPNYDSRHRAVGLGLDYRPNDNTRISTSVGAEVGGLLNGEVRPAAGIGVEIKWRRRRDVKNATLDEESSRKLFHLFDLDKDSQIDDIEWFVEGGKVTEFRAFVTDQDSNGDGKISLEEFLRVPVLHGLALHTAPPVAEGEPRED